ncbi:DUF3857 domain-containing protein [uncultured Planktosalinus sp.]|uniref:DUF3857 domain-containing protein n=1 Tax=uncultured Planktosalinus sp. TaxID=1810935 RepID=UPI0030DBA7CF
MKNILLLTVLFATVLNYTQAQRYDFGKISDEEIKQVSHPTDPEAKAAVLYKKGTVQMQYNNGWEYVYEMEARVKIYKQEGYDYATVEVPIYRAGAGKNEIFSNFKAFTHNIENGKTTKDRLRNSEIFDEDYNEFWDVKKFTFPNVKEGSVLEYTYKIISPYISSLPEFEFQDQIPVDYAEYTLKIPEYMNYETHSKGFYPLSRTVNTENSNLTYSYTPGQTDGTSVHGAHRTHYSTVSFTLYTTTFTAENVPKLVEEEYVNNIGNYLSSIRPELKSIQMPRSEMVVFSQTWNDVGREVYENKSFGKELESKNYFEKDLDPLIAQATNNVEKAALIFEYVKQHMTWNGNYNFYSHNGLKTAYKNRTGNVGDINLMLTAMLRYGGLEAHPVLVSTKSNGIPLFPTRSGFNYVISGVELGDKILLFDATSSYSTPNILPERVMNWFGRMIKPDLTTQQINLMSGIKSRRIVNLEVSMFENGAIEGKMRNSLTDQLALDHRSNYAGEAESAYLEKLEKKHGGILVSNYEIQNKKDPYKPVVESFDFEKVNAFDKIGDKIYVNPLFFLASTKNPFTTETREYPIDFRYPSSTTIMINLALPEGYTIESIPESEVFQLPDQVGQFQFMISENESKIQLRISSDINTSIMPATYYGALQEYFGALINKQAEQIVLSKT